MNKKYLRSLTVYILLLAGLLVAACNNSQRGDEGQQLYGIVAQDNSGSYVFLPVSSLTEKSITASGAQINLNGYGNYFGNVFSANGYLYTTMPGSGGKLLKHKLTGERLEKSGEVFLDGLMEDMWYNYYQTGTDTASFFGRRADDRFLTYNQVDIKNMTVLSAGNLPLPAPDTTRDEYFVDHGICIIRNHKLYLTYCYCNKNWEYKDTSYLAVMDYPGLTNVQISKYTDIGFPITYGAVPGAIISKNGDIYMTGGINDYKGITLQSGIYKISKDSGRFTEFIYANKKLGDGYALYGIWDLGNGNVLTRVAGPWFDKWASEDNTYDLYTANLSTGEFTKLNIPRSAHWGNSIIVKDGKVYIADNTDTCIYIYDIASGSISKGLQIMDANALVGIYPVKSVE